MRLEIPAWLTRLTAHRVLLRNAVLALTAACVVVYAAIGAGLIYKDTGSADVPRLWAFGFSAAAAFGLGIVLMLARSGRLVWILGAVFMVFAIWAYVAVAPRRDPPFEIWGISLKIVQGVILVALLGLLVGDRQAARTVRAERA